MHFGVDMLIVRSRADFVAAPIKHKKSDQTMVSG